MKTGKLDEYTIKARVFPAFLALLPLGVCAAQFVGFGSAIAAACSAFGGTALLSFVLAQWSRDAGKLKEQRLYVMWGGMPTTTYLRHRSQSGNSVVKIRRHRRLERLVPDLVMPSPTAEAANPAEADERYEAATKVLINRTRDKEKYGVLFQELIDYGFRRNVWGLKNYGIVILLCSMALDVSLLLLGSGSMYNIFSLVFFLICLIGWVAVVRPDWVRRSAESYAERLFDALDQNEALDGSVVNLIVDR